MLDKLKQLKQFREVQNLLSQKKATVEKSGVRVVVNGKMEIEQIQLNPALSQEKQAILLKECLNEAMKKIQQEIARQMPQILKGGF